MSALHALQSAEVVRLTEGEINGERPAFAKPGVYELVYLYDETIILSKKANKGRGVPKLVIWFRIVTPGEFFGLKIPAYYNVDEVEGRPRKYGGFKAGWHGHFIRDYATLFGLPQRRNRIPMTKFENCVIRGRVRTVGSTWYQKPLPQALHYSVVDELLSLDIGNHATASVTPSVSVTPTPTASPTPTLKQEAGQGKG